MPICPKCGRYHKRAHHKRHVKSCGGAPPSDYAVYHRIISKGASDKTYSPTKKKEVD